MLFQSMQLNTQPKLQCDIQIMLVMYSRNQKCK